LSKGKSHSIDTPRDLLRLLTLARDLRRRKAREHQSLFAVEGVRAVEELLRSPLVIRGALTAPQLDGAPRGVALRKQLADRGIEHSAVTEAEFRSAAETESPQGVLAIAEIPNRTLDGAIGSGNVRVLVLDAVQDPGNVGTILRTAAALGATATVSLPGTVDLWNAKVVRAAMGAHFTHAAFSGTTDELLTFLRTKDIELWGTDAKGEPVGNSPTPGRLALAMGNEGGGLSSSVRDAASRLVSLPIAAGVESLNVAVACGILLYRLRE
jgi:TrmH family RNA methyltransferase